MRKALRRAEKEGGVQLDVRRPQTAEEVRQLLSEGFEVEHRSWKGQTGSSVFASPQVFDFHVRQATCLAQHGLLELTFLRHGSKPIAFEYGWSTGGVYYTPKVGFDEGYSRFTPGQLLRYLVLEKAFANEQLDTIDYLGPLSDATAKWITSSYPVSRLIVATGKLGRSLLWSGGKLLPPLHAVS